MKAITKQLKQEMRIYPVVNNGKAVPNHYEIFNTNGKMLLSYESIIAFIPNDENVIYLGEDWDYSRTTGKYRNMFLNMDKKEILRRIENGTAKVVKL